MAKRLGSVGADRDDRDPGSRPGESRERARHLVHLQRHPALLRPLESLHRWSASSVGSIGNLEEVLLRAAGHYDINPKMTVGLGVLHTNVWPFEGSAGDGRTRSEDRIYQQFVYRHRWGRASVEHRFRFEQRWLDYFYETEFATRERYRFQITFPINNTKLVPGTNFVNIYNEFFVNQGGEPSLEQNRLYAAWGRKFTHQATLQLGLLWQHRSPGDFFRLQVFYTHNFDFR